MASEFSSVDYQCSQRSTVPVGPSYAGQPAGCAMAGSTPGSPLVEGSAYLTQAFSFRYSHVVSRPSFFLFFELSSQTD